MGEKLTVIDKPLEAALNAMTLENAQRVINDRLTLGDPSSMAAAQFMDELSQAEALLAEYSKKKMICKRFYKEGIVPYKVRALLPNVVKESMARLMAQVEAEQKAEEEERRTRRGAA